MKNKLAQFMQGRYGNDRFNQFLMIVAIVAMVISIFGGNLFWLLALLFMGYAYYRMFSRQIYKRSGENQWYLKQEMKVRSFFQRKKKELEIRKTHHIYHCPSCKQKIRVPKGKGKIEIRCQKCGTKFQKKS